MKCIVELFTSKNEINRIKVSSFTKTQDLTETHLIENLTIIIEKKLKEFSFADLITTHSDVLLKQSKKGTISLIYKNKSISNIENDTNLPHNKPKDYIVSVSLPYLKDLGIVDYTGAIKPTMSHKFKQINRFVEIISHHVRMDHSRPIIVDMGSGKGYLTFALHTYFADHLRLVPHISGFELREDLVELCNKISEKYLMEGLHFEAKNIIDADLGEVDVLIALHACDIATDMAIHKGIVSKAKYIVLSPCCHKQIRKEITMKNEITRYGIFEERMAEMITDTIRSLILNHYGYSTQIIEYISSEHTSKNTMIIAKYTNINQSNSLEKVADLKNQYGIGQ
ncbi:MAG TPA: SAM-dependent methyltransferase, partial [Saprospiraceae bacterium]|nr:SAM-dependent methyltransferase [Saprospiraceae bacterium]